MNLASVTRWRALTLVCPFPSKLVRSAGCAFCALSGAHLFGFFGIIVFEEHRLFIIRVFSANSAATFETPPLVLWYCCSGGFRGRFRGRFHLVHAGLVLRVVDFYEVAPILGTLPCFCAVPCAVLSAANVTYGKRMEGAC